MECRAMEPIVNGLKKHYADCLSLVRVNYHTASHWREKLTPMASPEFALVDSAETVLYRWVGATDMESFNQILAPLCGE
jgi:hypothetical protein